MHPETLASTRRDIEEASAWRDTETARRCIILGQAALLLLAMPGEAPFLRGAELLRMAAELERESGDPEATGWWQLAFRPYAEAV